MHRAATESDLLHHGGRPGRWGSLGLWPTPAGDAAATLPDYFGACASLAGAVAQAAGVQPGQRVLCVACGDGEELQFLTQQFPAIQVLGIDTDAARVARAAQRCAGLANVDVRVGSGTGLTALALPAASFDRVLCVDAAYHLAPRSAFLQGALALLRPGGTLAYTDLVGPPGQAGRSHWLPFAARLCGLGGDALADDTTQLQRLRDAGFAAPRLQRLDDAVLGGFVRFVQQQSRTLPGGRWQSGWRRVATTAWLIPRCRAAGLGYALLSATRPLACPEVSA